MGIWHGVGRGLGRGQEPRTSQLQKEHRDPVPTQPALPNTRPVPGSAWACLASLHTSRSSAQLGGDWGGGTWGSTEEPDTGRRGWGTTPQSSDAHGTAWV